MHNDSHGHDNPTPIPDSGRLYETRDVSLSALSKWVAFLFVFVAGASSVTWVLFHFVYVPGGEEQNTQFPITTTRQLPREPKLQANPIQDIKEFRAKEETTLNGYGRDPGTGAIHIPVDHAIDLVLQDLPTRPGAGTVKLEDVTTPNAAPLLNGQAPAGTLPLSSGDTESTQQPGQPGMNLGHGTEPTPTAPGNSTSSPTNGGATNSGGGAPLPMPASPGGTSSSP